jgi:hypothetical protein
MVSISLGVRSLAFATEQGVPIPARRLFVTAYFLGKGGQRIPIPAFLDVGAPYNVVPHRLASPVDWVDAGGQAILPTGKSHTIEWFGITCRMREARLELVDLQQQIRTRALRLLAKVPLTAAPAALEKSAILGMNFLTDNGLRLEVDAAGSQIAALIAVP